MQLSLELNRSLGWENLTITANVNGSLMGYPSLQDQLPHHFFNESVNWGLDFNTSVEFWMDLSDQMIWMTDNGMMDNIPLVIVFKAFNGTAEDLEAIYLELSNVNDPPPTPQWIRWDPEIPLEGDTVLLEADPVIDPDLDHLSYIWRLGDDNLAGGRQIEHAYTDPGTYNISLWVEDEEYRSEAVRASIIIKEKIVEKDEEKGEETNKTEPEQPPEEEEAEKGLPWIFAWILLALITLLLIASLPLLFKKKKKDNGKKKKEEERPYRIILDVVHGPDMNRKAELKSRLDEVKSSMRKGSL